MLSTANVVRRSWCVTSSAALFAALVSAGCSGGDRRLQQRQEKFESLAASAAAIGEAWIDHNVSSVYTRTALDRTYLLVEQERSSLASSPENLLDARGAQLSETAERLARILALLMADVNRGDLNSTRRHLAALPRSSDLR